MKKALVLVALLAPSLSIAGGYVNGYTKKDGTYVSGYYRSDSDANRYNNQGSQSNGGSQRDEHSSGTGATNKSNGSYGWRDNDSDGASNPYDRYPDSRRKGW